MADARYSEYPGGECTVCGSEDGLCDHAWPRVKPEALARVIEHDAVQRGEYGTATRDALVALGLIDRAGASVLAGARQSGDRQLPPPYDAMNASDREAWLVYEGLFDGAITDDVRRANAGHSMASWAELKPEAHQALVTVLGQVIPILHAVALNPEARRAGE